jgi:hypothetical protein
MNHPTAGTIFLIVRWLDVILSGVLPELRLQAPPAHRRGTIEVFVVPWDTTSKWPLLIVSDRTTRESQLREYLGIDDAFLFGAIDSGTFKTLMSSRS